MNKDVKLVLLSLGAVITTGLTIGASLSAFNSLDWKKATGFGSLAVLSLYVTMKLSK